MRSLGRLLAVSLGTIGCLAFLSGAAASWWYASELREISAEGFDDVNSAVVRLDERCASLETDFDRTFGEIIDVRDRLEQTKQDLVEQQVKQTLSRISDEVGPRVVRAEEFLNLLSQILQMVESRQGRLVLPQADGESGSARIDQILDYIESVQSEVNQFLNGFENKRIRGDFVDLVKSLLGKLEAVRNGLTELRQYLQIKQEALARRQLQVDLWIRYAGWIGIGFCLWMFFGQFSMARHACRKPPKPPAGTADA